MSVQRTTLSIAASILLILVLAGCAPPEYVEHSIDDVKARVKDWQPVTVS